MKMSIPEEMENTGSISCNQKGFLLRRLLKQESFYEGCFITDPSLCV